MIYRDVKNALVELLDTYSAGRYTVIGRQRQNKSAEDLRDKFVQVYYTEGNLPKNSSRMRGDKTHDITINIDLTVSASAKGNLDVLTSQTSTAIEKNAALVAVKEASEVADTKIDDLIDAVYQIIMDPRNEDIGLGRGEIANRWIDRIQKDTLLDSGDLVVKTALLRYTCRITEIVDGDGGHTPETVIYNTDIEADDEGAAGVFVENDNT